ncbi:ABC transporter substrate-binding protein [Hydrogenophaga pseudoflava]|uniref:ABC transporter substrate-binding protein n=1 Tax=Hydrogenophaga pseudoflava TaxID=47421 RepID=UPI0027E4CB98|nr:ABC transporter substrate-binding protein [Hydrogenophaga pseudoflava]MDQ7745120.1 ABC transporter substrate-binding protein [Hydrogenophaga pseudoflava]
MQRRRVLSSLGACLGASTLASVAGSAWAQAAAGSGAIVLGQSAPLTGPSAQLGLQFNLGAQLYFDQVNAAGGVNGRRIELRRLDDGYEPERCVANTKQFIADGVFALFGYVGTASSLAALPLATEAKMPFFAPFTGAQALREPFNRYAIHVRASYFDETAAIVKQVTSIGIKRVAVFYQNDAYGKAGLEGVQRALKALGMEPAAVGTVERNSTEVAQALKDVLAVKPEAIVQIGAYKACATFIRLARQQGYAGNFYNVSFVGTQALLDELGAVAKGVAVSQVMPFPYSPATPLSGEYLAALKDQRGVSPNYSGIEGFVAAKVLVEGLKRARGAGREAFIDAIAGMKDVSIGGFPLDFGPQKHTGSRFVELTLLTEDGRVRR